MKHTPLILAQVLDVQLNFFNDINFSVLGSIGSLILSVYYLKYVAEDWPHRLAFSIFFFGAVFCMGASAIYHAFICHSEPVCKFLAKYVCNFEAAILFSP